MSKVPTMVTTSIRDGSTPDDAQLAALCAFTRTLLSTRGLPSKRDVEGFLAAGYSERQVLEVILAIALKTISNYTNHMVHTPVDAAFAAYAWRDPKAV
jgi:alkylhydroperoxidase family enzyme